MTPDTAAAILPESDSEGAAIALRSSTELQMVPPERDGPPPKPAVASPIPIAAALPASPPSISLASLTRFETALPTAVALPRSLVAAPPPELTWALASAALAAGVGWIYERRRRLQMEADGGANPWATEPASRRRHSAGDHGETFPESRELVETAHPVYVSIIGDTPSRREATLVDLHDLNERLWKLSRRKDLRAAAELLEQHLVDFRYSSPWVFLELRALYKSLDQREEWELVRDAFRSRFGQNAPQWNAATNADAEIADDKQLCGDLLRKWPQREARLFILRWMLGDAASRQKNAGPPQLALGVYRDMLLLDSILDEVISSRPAPPVLATPA